MPAGAEEEENYMAADDDGEEEEGGRSSSEGRCPDQPRIFRIVWSQNSWIGFFSRRIYAEQRDAYLFFLFFPSGEVDEGRMTPPPRG